MTVELCINFCINVTQPYAGLQFGKECFCGSSYSKYGQVNQANCSYPCSGDVNKKCGGIRLNDIYFTGILNASFSSQSSNLKQFTTSRITNENLQGIFQNTSSVYKPTLKETTVPSTIVSIASNIGNLISSSMNATNNEQENKNFSSVSASLGDISKKNLTTVSYFSNNFTATFSELNLNNTNTATFNKELSNSTIFNSIISFSNINQNYQISENEVSTKRILSEFNSDSLNTKIEFYQSTSFDFTTMINRLNSNSPSYPTTSYSNLNMNISDSINTSKTFSSIQELTYTNQLTYSSFNSTQTIPSNLTISSNVGLLLDTSKVTKIITPNNITGISSTENGASAEIDSNYYLITILSVNKTLDTQSVAFRNDITQSLSNVYKNAFEKANAIFYRQNTNIDKTYLSKNQINDPKVNIIDIVKTSKANADNTKNEVNIRYYIKNNNRLVQPDFASDSINLLSDQEISQILKQQVVDPGYIDSKPRTVTSDDQRLWIIGAVLGPLAFLIILFWIIAFIYYKCINPRQPLIAQEKLANQKRLMESPLNSQENIQTNNIRRCSKIQPTTNDTSYEEYFTGEKSAIESFVALTTSPLVKEKRRKSQIMDTVKPKNDENKSKSEQDKFIQDEKYEYSIRQKLELEKWRNKQRQREREFEMDTKQIEPEAKLSNKQSSKKILPVTNDNHLKQEKNFAVDLSPKSFRNTKHEVSILTNTDLLEISKNEDQDIIVSQSSKKLISHHIPVKVHVKNEPSQLDTSRVYNPYPVQEEYEKYVKNGFVFEPLKPTETSKHKDDMRRITSIESDNARPIKNQNISNANIAFSSEAISPYYKKDNIIVYKNPVDNDKLLNQSRGITNKYLKRDSLTEFQNLNNLKNYSDSRIKSGTKEKILNDENPQKTSKTESINFEETNKRLYEDEYYLENMFDRKNKNNDVIDSINKEIKKLKKWN